MGTFSESGAEAFRVHYFDKTAYLAQSPQFYKQMAMAAGFGLWRSSELTRVAPKGIDPLPSLSTARKGKIWGAEQVAPRATGGKSALAP
jgi:hypothetical protein